MIKSKMTASILAFLLTAVSAGITANADPCIAYYDKNGTFIDARTINLDYIDEDLNEYANYYAPNDSVNAIIFEFADGLWKTDKVEIVKESDRLSYTQKAPNVTDDMCLPQYWTRDGDYDLILSKRKIKELNARILKNEKTMMNDLDNLPETYNGKELATAQSGFASPTGIYLDGKPVEESYYDAIRKNIKNENLSENEKVRYGICTERTVLKAYPYDDWLSDSEWDKEWDNFVNSAVLFGEPLVLYNTTADGAFVYARSVCCEGWVKTEDVAVCKNKTEWMNAKEHKNFIVVTGERVWLEPSYDEDLSEKQLTMGTVLGLADSSSFEQLNRLAWNNYTVAFPVRKSDGSYAEKTALISANRDVTVDYMPYTRANVIGQAFKSLGNRYGWGGMLNSQDCSSFVREVYLCFGIVIPRNTTWQSAMPVRIIDISQMTDEEKKAELDKTPSGAILFFPGHEMIYLGTENGLYYTVNDVSSIVNPEDPEGGIIRPRSVIINDLSTLRANGTSWLSNLTTIAVIE